MGKGTISAKARRIAGIPPFCAAVNTAAWAAGPVEFIPCCHPYNAVARRVFASDGIDLAQIQRETWCGGAGRILIGARPDFRFPSRQVLRPFGP